jgi:hypothetical protein
VVIIISPFAAILPACAWIQLWHRFAFWFSLIPGAWGHSLLGPSPTLIVVFVFTPPLYLFKESAALIHSERRRGDRMDRGS